jgi:hypothetical protein
MAFRGALQALVGYGAGVNNTRVHRCTGLPGANFNALQIMPDWGLGLGLGSHAHAQNEQWSARANHSHAEGLWTPESDHRHGQPRLA